MVILQYQFTNIDEQDVSVMDGFGEFVIQRILETINTKINRKKISIRLKYMIEEAHWINWYGSKRYNTSVQDLIQAIADKYNDSVEIVTDEDLTNELDYIKNAKAYIQGGKVKININSATAADALHELTHLVLASMKFSDDAMIRQTYYNLVSTMMDRNIIPENRFNEIVKRYIENSRDGLVTSDILEEVLANEFAFYLSGELLGETPKLITTNVETNMLKALAEVLELKQAPALTEIQGKSFGEIMQALGKNILNVRSIDSNFVMRTQKVAKMEDLLYKQQKLTCK